MANVQDGQIVLVGAEIGLDTRVENTGVGRCRHGP